MDAQRVLQDLDRIHAKMTRCCDLNDPVKKELLRSEVEAEMRIMIEHTKKDLLYQREKDLVI